MSNFYKGNVALNQFVSYITNSSAYNSYTNLGITLNTGYTSVFTSSVNEVPSNINYQYQNADISTYCIAPWVESTGTKFTAVPSWCNKIRAVLIGGGGGGVTGQNASTQQDVWYQGHVNYTHTHDHNHYHVNYIHQHDHGGFKFYDFDGGTNVNNDRDYDWDGGTNWNVDYQVGHTHITANNDAASQMVNKGGSGGGGGGFVYISLADVASNRNLVKVSAGNGGIASIQGTTAGSGNATTLTISANTTYTAGGGAGGTKNLGGAGGTSTAPTFIALTGGSSGNPGNSNGSGGTTGGTSGITSTYSTNSTILSYGVGGQGSAGSQNTGGSQQNSYSQTTTTTQVVSSANSGTNGYYRIYFLTG